MTETRNNNEADELEPLAIVLHKQENIIFESSMTWVQLSSLARDAYRRDASALAEALAGLGWGTPKQLESARRIAVQLEQEDAEQRRLAALSMLARPVRRRLLTPMRLAVLGIILAVASLVMVVLP